MCEQLRRPGTHRRPATQHLELGCSFKAVYLQVAAADLVDPLVEIEGCALYNKIKNVPSPFGDCSNVLSCGNTTMVIRANTCDAQRPIVHSFVRKLLEGTLVRHGGSTSKGMMFSTWICLHFVLLASGGVARLQSDQFWQNIAISTTCLIRSDKQY